jgi:DNA-binding SARP family transcriptional activator
LTRAAAAVIVAGQVTRGVSLSVEDAALNVAADARYGPSPALEIALLKGFDLRRGDERVSLPLSAQRVLAFVALHDQPLQRVFVAGSLWMDSPEERANASLRTALWRLQQPGCSVVDVTSTHVALCDEVAVDLRCSIGRARRILAGGECDRDELIEFCAAGELLPDWYDDWVTIERERFRQLRLHALEALCRAWTSRGLYADATVAGIAAVAAEPLRESAHRVLIETFLAERNLSDAIRQYRLFRDLLAGQLGLQPSDLMEELVAGLPRG